jgi:hypothetical protein
VFAEGSFSVENMFPVDAKEHFALSGHIIKQIQSLPDGSQVSISIKE